MKGRGAIGSAWVLAFVCACRPPVEPAAPADDAADAAEFEAGPLEPSEPANKAAGDELSLVIPGVESEVIDLATLRGQTVILAVSGTTEANFEELLSWLEAMQAAAPDRVSVLVASDPEADALDAILSPVRLGWDPQGAVAARLSVARLPTVFVIDPEGRVRVVTAGFEAAHRTQLEEALAL